MLHSLPHRLPQVSQPPRGGPVQFAGPHPGRERVPDRGGRAERRRGAVRLQGLGPRPGQRPGDRGSAGGEGISTVYFCRV